MEDVKLTFTPEALDAIADKAMQRKTGARGLRSIVEETLLDIMFDLPSQPDVVEVIVDADSVTDKKPPQLIHGQKVPKKQEFGHIHPLAS